PSTVLTFLSRSLEPGTSSRSDGPRSTLQIGHNGRIITERTEPLKVQFDFRLSSHYPSILLHRNAAPRCLPVNGSDHRATSPSTLYRTPRTVTSSCGPAGQSTVSKTWNPFTTVDLERADSSSSVLGCTAQFGRRISAPKPSTGLLYSSTPPNVIGWIITVSPNGCLITCPFRHQIDRERTLTTEARHKIVLVLVG